VRLEKKIGTLVLVMLLACTMVQAQQRDPRVNPPVAPLPPLSPSESSSTTAPGAEPAVAPAKPQPRAASDIEQADLGGWGGGGQSMILYGFRVSFHADSNPSAGAGPGRLQGVTTVSWNAGLVRNWHTSTLSLDYASGAMLYNTRVGENRQGHTLGLRYTVTGRAWSFTLRDSVSLLPESSFGFWAGAGSTIIPGAPGQVQSQLNPLLVPSQSILTGTERRISNTLAGQVSFALTPRSSLAVTSSHGIFRGLGSNLIDSHRWSVGTTYNYLLTSRDSLGVSYSHSRFGFDQSSFGFSGNSLNVSYSRQLTGRLSLTVGGGPHISQFRNQVAGSGTRVSSSMRAGLQYQLRTTTLDLAYTRGITTGSGVLLGADTDLVEGGVSKQLSRMWRMSTRLGYARNVSLVQSTGLTNQLTFNGWHGHVSFARPIGRYARLGLNYGVNGEHSSSAFCLGATCGGSTIRHRFGLTFEFSPNFPPIILE
jgi:hypothetical protein